MPGLSGAGPGDGKPGPGPYSGRRASDPIRYNDKAAGRVRSLWVGYYARYSIQFQVVSSSIDVTLNPKMTYIRK